MDNDNGPPFNSNEFKEFAEQEAFQHHRITPLHPRVNVKGERMLNKTELDELCSVISTIQSTNGCMCVCDHMII